MKKPTKDELTLLQRDVERIYNLALKCYKKFDGWKDPLDEIFVTEREGNIIRENNKLKKQLEEQKSVNQHLERIYKRDTNTDIPTKTEKQE